MLEFVEEIVSEGFVFPLRYVAVKGNGGTLGGMLLDGEDQFIAHIHVWADLKELLVLADWYCGAWVQDVLFND